MDFTLFLQSVGVELSQTRVKDFSLALSLSLSLSPTRVSSSLCPPSSASIPLSTASGLCYLITLPPYQITEGEHKLTREGEPGFALLFLFYFFVVCPLMTRCLKKKKKQEL